MYGRIVLIRKSLKMTQTEFGDALGVSRGVIANIEIGRVEPSDMMIQLICIKFHVSEQWLRLGEGEMYEPDKPESDVDLFLKANNIVDLEAELIKAYLELPPELRKIFIDHFKDYFARKKALQEAESAAAPPDDSFKEADSHDDK